MDKALIVVEHVGLTTVERERLLRFIRDLKWERKKREEPPIAYIWSGDGGGIAPVLVERFRQREAVEQEKGRYEE